MKPIVKRPRWLYPGALVVVYGCKSGTTYFTVHRVVKTYRRRSYFDAKLVFRLGGVGDSEIVTEIPVDNVVPFDPLVIGRFYLDTVKAVTDLYEELVLKENE